MPGAARCPCAGHLPGQSHGLSNLGGAALIFIIGAVARLRSFLQSRSLVRPQVPNGSLFLRGVLRQSALTWHPEQSA